MIITSAKPFEEILAILEDEDDICFLEGQINSRFIDMLDEIVGKRLWQDAKSRFQEEAQERTGITPSYEVVRESGPDHDKSFEVGVYIGKELIAKGSGRSKFGSLISSSFFCQFLLPL